MYSIKDRKFSENLNELVSLQNQVKLIRLQDELGKQNFHEDMKNVFEPVTDTIEKTSENLTKTITESSKENNKALENKKGTIMEIKKDRGILSFYPMSALSKKSNLENTTEFKLVKDSNSNRVNGLLMHNSIPITLLDNLLTFRDTGKIFELKGELLKLLTDKNYIVDLPSLLDKKLMYDFAKGRHFDVKGSCNESNRD